MAEMMRVKLIKNIFRAGVFCGIGTVLTMEDKLARELIAMKKAVAATPEDEENVQGGNKK